MPTIDLEVTTLREFNQTLHDLGEGTNDTYFRVVNPRGRHAIAAGVDAPVTIEIDGNARPFEPSVAVPLPFGSTLAIRNEDPAAPLRYLIIKAHV